MTQPQNTSSVIAQSRDPQFPPVRPIPAAHRASPSVPLDSWIYAAFDRLAALGYAPAAHADLRPWTRLECARIVFAAGEALSEGAVARLPDSSKGTGNSWGSRPLGTSGKSASEAGPLQAALALEFAAELQMEGFAAAGAQVESAYVRYLGISGWPLADGYHLGQTLINDYGRPFGEGSNPVGGVSASGWAGPVAFYLRTEYQHAAPLPAYTTSLQRTLGLIDDTPPQDPVHHATVNQVHLLEAYAAWNLKGVQVSAGRQSLWWGPGRSGPPNFSDDAPPVGMLRFSNPSPWRPPAWLHWLGPMRWDIFFGVLAGHHYPPGPALDGQKVSFKPTPNLELGFSRTIVFRPLTPGMVWRGLSSFGDNPSTVPGSAADVGDRRGGFDFSYRVPGLRDWLVLYSDGMTDDDTSPLGAPQHALMNPGIYLPHLPRLSKLDFRSEAVWSDPPALSHRGGRYVYYNGAYHDAYTNDGNLLGSWVGREGRGLQIWSTYWFSPRTQLQAGYRQAHVDRDFIPGGGDIRDYFLRSTAALKGNMQIDAFLQYERWNFSVLSPLAQPNTAASVQITYRPKWAKTRKPE